MMYSNETAGRGSLNNEQRPIFGLLEWFHIGDEARVEEILADAAALGVEYIRTGVSWADFFTKEGPDWYDWLLPKLSSQVQILPCFTYTPPSEGIVPKVSSPPREPKKFADFLDVAISRYGHFFDQVELWNEPNGLVDWDWRLDPEWKIFSEMIGMAAHWAKHRGKKTVLGGLCPTDPNWMDLMARRGVLDKIDVLGIHGFPGTWEFDWTDWSEKVSSIQAVLDRYDLACKIWITEAGYSTWRHDEFNQLIHFAQGMKAPVERVYWYSARDLKPDRAHQEGFRQDERHYHLGLKSANGRPKLLFRVLENHGIDGLQKLKAMAQPALPKVFTTPMAIKTYQQPEQMNSKNKSGSSLITGGAGFIGINLADRLLSQGKNVLIFDNLSRPEVEKNLRWLQAKYPKNLRVEIADVRNRFILEAAVKEADEIYHFAGQVAVTTSLTDPGADFEINARGTLNLIEALRKLENPPPLLFTSTNKVYGALSQLPLQKQEEFYEPVDERIRRHGISESWPLQFQTPYGCSKGTADQYVLEYARSFNCPATVFRMSCIYGTHQFGTEDQGWVAHFLLQTMAGKPITIYGDGRQVRDVLFIDDLLNAMELAQQQMNQISGRAFNIGGGPKNSLSLLQLISLIDELRGIETDFTFSDWRPGDQPWFVSDIRAFSNATGWKPKTSIPTGINALYQWVRENQPPQQKRARKRSTARIQQNRIRSPKHPTMKT
ncbi:MAG TPA: NAD-dependent epimerase/dehydratase family protein [Opitutales bacterium]|nr:NAD-dependent epimerase/dehydratase family protein [Opitutales bacterium]